MKDEENEDHKLTKLKKKSDLLTFEEENDSVSSSCSKYEPSL